MDQNLEKHQYIHQHQHQHQTATDDGSHCSNCGAPLAPGARFCEECGAPQGGNRCVSCGAEIKPGMAICPVCGCPATTNCTFCGSEMAPGQTFCPECGNPRGGITCPECGTLNFRSFCRKCNHPLNPMALYAVEQAKADPRYQRALKLAEEMQTLEDQIQLLEQQLAQQKLQQAAPAQTLDTALKIDAATQKLLDEFAQLERARGHAPTEAPKPQQASKPQQQQQQAKPQQLSLGSTGGSGGDLDLSGGGSSFADTAAKLAQLKAQYAAKVKEFQAEIDQMVPNPADPPEVQRNFACAHMITTTSKVTTVTKQTQRIAWVCNRCHIWHNKPSECGVREFGGKWVTKDVITTSVSEVVSNSSIKL